MRGIQLQILGEPVLDDNFEIDFKEGIPMALYSRGTVLDIRPSKNGAPNRIRINDIKLMVSYCDGLEWSYKCEFESDRREHILSEPALLDMVIPMHSPVYKNSVIQRRYSNGWRFYGNMPLLEAKQLGSKLANRDNIAHIRICEAYNNKGKLLTDGRVALWIRYRKPIEGAIKSNINITIK